MKPPVTVVVPTRNSARTLEACLASLRAQQHRCRIVVVDNFSTDATPQIARRLADRFVEAGPERSRQRNVGAALEVADVIGFVDSDMYLEPEVVGEVVAAIASGAAAVTVPERSVGEGYWARVRAKERSFYGGSGDVEAPRFFAARVFDAAGAFDESLDAAEDWDLALRTRRFGPVGRTRADIEHDEGHPSYRACLAKKASYAEGIKGFSAKHGMAALGRTARRRYLRRPWLLFTSDPHVGVGVAALKLGELAAVTGRLVRGRHRSLPQETRPRPEGTSSPGGRTGDVPPWSMRRVHLVMPAYNEAGRIERNLDGVAASELPSGFVWAGWRILVDGSSDGTAEAARRWAACHLSLPVDVVDSPCRRGKAAQLEAMHRELLESAGRDEIVVVLDADVTLEPDALRALVTAFEDPESPAVVWGRDEPDDLRVGRWASAFQMEVTDRLARAGGRCAPRAYGRFFAYRLGPLGPFHWCPGQVDDVQLEQFVISAGLVARSSWQASVRVTPARGYRDFYLQTYRGLTARRRARPEATGCDEATGRPVRLYALAAASVSDPLRAVAYLVARLVAAGVHVVRPSEFADTWEPSASTKAARR